ncbi:aldehyde dehydrogenase [Cohnella sp. REN36]|uniref:aldehyde dehydrogenase n=1 Tax=Cohnella sp. REN36 TaxID=2887347 RepID=UPI001D14545C|nr:aldehyde dehydrogenase [Cohnella sp. REN36]
MDDCSALIRKQKEYFETGATRPLDFRLTALRKLGDAIRAREGDLLEALRQDLNKSAFEAYASEIGIVLKEIRFVAKRLRAWMRPRKVKTPLTHVGSRGAIYSEPYGVALIVAPWNFPFQLAVAPLVGAIAAGNCAVIKPSELTPRTSAALAALIRDVFDEAYVAVVPGDAETSRSLLAEPVDYIFFTGGTAVGQLVMEAASKRLTPVTLELGGKSPCLVHEDANLRLAAKRIAWGKFMNAGQTCIAPDYLYVHESVLQPFLGHLKRAIAELYGEQPLANRAYTRIVSDKHFRRLQAFLGSGTVATGGKTDAEALRIEPTVLTGISPDDPVMADEIFGPILPVLAYRELDPVLAAIRGRPKPLALYLFSESKAVQSQVLAKVSFGGGCVNDTVYHFTSPYLPFGGVGGSGMGAYHGRSSFDLFSHRKSVLKQTTKFDLPFRYPNAKHALKRIKRFLK